jgi:hypothetical protein
VTRIENGGAQAVYHPYGTGGTPMVMPLALVRVTQDGMTYETMQPLFTGDVNAAPLPATAPGSWGQLYAAGRP